MKAKLYVYLIAISMLIDVFLLAWIPHKEGFSTIRTFKTKGRIVFHGKENVPREKITDFLIYEDRIFVFYEDAGIVNIYTIDGEFVQCIQVCTINNSHGGIAMDHGSLLIKSKNDVIYVVDVSTLCLSYFLTVTHGDWENQTEKYRQYEKLIEVFSQEQKREGRAKKFLLSDSQEDILVSEPDGRYRSVGFLPKRSPCYETLWVMLVVLIVGLCELLRRRKGDGLREPS